MEHGDSSSQAPFPKKKPSEYMKGGQIYYLVETHIRSEGACKN